MGEEIRSRLTATIPQDVQIITGGRILYTKNSDVDKLYNIQDIIFENQFYDEAQVNMKKKKYIDFYKSNLIDASTEENYYRYFYRRFQVNTKSLNEDIQRYGEIENIIVHYKNEYMFQKNNITGDKIKI